MISENSGCVQLESTSNIKISDTLSYQNVIDIENITRSWFQLMVKLNESPALRDYFAEESFNEESNEWDLNPTEYTRHFLTSGLVIYQVNKVEGNVSTFVKDVIVTSDDSKESIEQKTKEIFEYESSDGYSVSTLQRWAGCGMSIPKNIRLALAPNNVWPILEATVTDENGERQNIRIENSANKIFVSQETEGSSGNKEKGYILVTNKLVQGQTKGKLKVEGTSVDNLTLTLPYTCASFDILTEISIGDEEELILFTS